MSLTYDQELYQVAGVRPLLWCQRKMTITPE